MREVLLSEGLGHLALARVTDACEDDRRILLRHDFHLGIKQSCLIGGGRFSKPIHCGIDPLGKYMQKPLESCPNQRIMSEFPFFPSFYQASIFENLQVMGYG